MSKRQLRGPLLRSVSRSFFLSIRILPVAVREPVALAYLLARATDTIADTKEVGLGERLDALPKFSSAISGADASQLAELRSSFTPLQQNAAERVLIGSIPQLLEWMNDLGDQDREDVQAVLATITRGQMSDLQRFSDATRITALNTAAELDEYTYLVAGCVGEFWTRICARNVPRFARKQMSELLASGVAYGKGLQLINILRDTGRDLRAGRCYLPADEIAVAPSELLAAPEAAADVLCRWLDIAERGLLDGIQYADAVINTRTRIATALPALIGLRTLRLLRSAGTRVLHAHIKVPRAEVRSLALRAVIARASPAFLTRESNAAASR